MEPARNAVTRRASFARVPVVSLLHAISSVAIPSQKKNCYGRKSSASLSLPERGENAMSKFLRRQYGMLQHEKFFIFVQLSLMKGILALSKVAWRAGFCGLAVCPGQYHHLSGAAGKERAQKKISPA